MILKKPYAFFIKMFKPIHLILALLVAFLIYLENKILSFLNVYMYSSSDVTSNVSENLSNSLLFIIPIIIIIFSLTILGIMFRKKKSVVFYFVNIFAFIIIIVVNLYVSNFLGILQDTIVSIRIVKLIHDLLFISIIIESVLFVFFVVRGMGVNFKKFNFDSDISKFEINESDQEEFEVEINVDLDESKRKRKRKLRYLKYAYVENKFLVNTVIIGVVIIFATILVLSLLHGGVNKENVIYSVDTFNIEVENTNILNTDYKGNKIIDDYLLVVNTKISSDLEGVSLYLNDFSLKIGDAIFKPVIKYSNLLSDLGNSYNENTLSSEYTNYLFVFEIPEKYKTSEMLFRYNGNGENIDIKLNPKNLETDKIYTTAKIGENISFEKIIGNIEFKINQYEIKDKFLLNYNFCIEKDDCIESKEYLVPTINQNFDKYILRLDINYTNNSDLDINNFYDFFEKFGLIQYKIEDKWFTQSSNFENIESSKVTTKDNVYIGVDSNISKATEIKLVFKIRDSKYEYSLK